MPDAVRKSSAPADRPALPGIAFALKALPPRVYSPRLQGAHSDRRKRHGLSQSAPEFPSRAIRFSSPALALNGEARKERSPLPKGRLLHAAFSPSRTPCENRPPISHSFCAQSAAPARHSPLLQGAHSDRRKRRDLPQSALEFSKHAIRFSSPGTGLKRRSPQRALPPLKGRLLHAAFSPCRTPCESSQQSAYTPHRPSSSHYH